jgi:hypothetical protein
MNKDIQLTTYRFSDIEDWEDFVNNLFNGLKHYEKRNVDFKFTMTFRDNDIIEVKTVKLGIHAN